jgi:hypothetical protein
MADRAAIRVAIDLGFAAALIACAATGYASSRIPEMPGGVCTSTSGGPRYDAMLADGTITIAAVFGELSGGPTDPNAWSYRAFADALVDRGFVGAEPGVEYTQGHEIDRYRRGNVTIDLVLIADDTAQSTAAIAGALASHDVVYYNGHSHHGDIVFDPPSDYRLIIVDSCWSTQHFAKRLVSPHRDVITNTERSVTGSIESFLVLIDALTARAPAWPLGEMNELAVARARVRAPLAQFNDPERYRLDVACPQ